MPSCGSQRLYETIDMKHLTLKDLARELGLSTSTVSRAFQPDSEISEATRSRVLALAKRVGFHHNPLARRLHQQQTFQVGVVLPELLEDFFGKVLLGIQQVMGESGYQLLITQSGESPQQEQKNVEQLVANRVDGLLVSLSQTTQEVSYLEQLHQQGLPMVLFNRTLDQLSAPRVLFNDRKWAQFATEHLIQQGCRHIWHLSGPRHLGLSRAREQGYQQALHKYQQGEGIIIEAGFSRSDGAVALKEALSTQTFPDGIFAVNDPVAIGAIQALRAEGLSVPTQVAVMGFSSSHWGDWVSPPLSSVRQPTIQMGVEAANLLLKHLQRSGVIVNQVNLEGELVIRTSSMLGSS